MQKEKNIYNASMKAVYFSKICSVIIYHLVPFLQVHAMLLWIIGNSKGMARQTYTQHNDLISIISFLKKEKLAKHHLTALFIYLQFI
jgi:hypothetical protein